VGIFFRGNSALKESTAGASINAWCALSAISAPGLALRVSTPTTLADYLERELFVIQFYHNMSIDLYDLFLQVSIWRRSNEVHVNGLIGIETKMNGNLVGKRASTSIL